VTIYPSYVLTGELPACANWVFMFERTLPNQGGRSLVDNELSDSGAVLAHEIGHQLVSGCCSCVVRGWAQPRTLGILQVRAAMIVPSMFFVLVWGLSCAAAPPPRTLQSLRCLCATA
jgi:hypothetical protein